MARIVLYNKLKDEYINPYYADTRKMAGIIDLDYGDDGDDDPAVKRPNYLYVPLSLRPIFNVYTQTWHKNVIDKLQQIHTFLQPRVYYNSDAEDKCIVLRSSCTAKCLAVLLYFLVHYHWGDANRADDEMMLYKKNWGIEKTFPPLFTQTIFYPILINSFHFIPEHLL